MTGAELIAEILRREDTDCLFAYPNTPLVDACAAIDIRPLLCRQERVGVGMAEGYTRIHRGRRNGVFACQGGAGAENAFPGIAQAFSGNVPILVITSSSDLSRRYREPVFRAADVFRPVSKWSALVHSVNEIPGVMRRAYHLLRSGKPGPVVLEIAPGVWSAAFEGELDYRPVPMVRTGPDPDAVRRAADMLLAAKAPVIWAGQGVLFAGASTQLVALAELLPAPVLTTNPGKSAIPENHPLALGASAAYSRTRAFSKFLTEADVVLVIGSSLSSSPFGPQMVPGKAIIHSTQADTDINKDFPCEIGLVGDAALVLDALIQEIGTIRKTQKTDELLKLENAVQEVKRAWNAEWAGQLSSDETPINQYRIIKELMATVDLDNVIITHDAGSPREQLMPFWEARKPLSYLGWGKTTQLGHGLGLAMGAKIAKPDAICINIMGDAAIGMTGLDLETAARNGIALLTIVFNNGVMACERERLLVAIDKFDVWRVGGDYVQVAKGLNVDARQVADPADIVSAIKEALEITKSGKPFLLEFLVKQNYDFSREALEGNF